MVSFALSVVGVILIAVTGKRTIRLAAKVVNALFDKIEKEIL